MHLVARIIFIIAMSGLLAAQAPTKNDPQGFSKEILDEAAAKPKSELGAHPVYTPPSPDSPQQPAASLPADLDKIIATQFGPKCKIARERSGLVVNYRVKTDSAWTPFLTTDLDGDNVADAIIVARCESALALKDQFGYQMIDPYMAFHGYGDSKITAEFTEGDPNRGHVVLIIHGAGAEAWRAAAPKAKFLVLNLPFNNLGLTHVATKKKRPPIAALLLQEGETMSSVVFWDGKKYKWRDSIGNK